MQLNKEDQEFINNLSHEMKTQDTRCTASPYALVITSSHKVYGFKMGNAEYSGVYDTENCENFYHEEDFNEFISDLKSELSDENLKEFEEILIDRDIDSYYDIWLHCDDFIPSRFEFQGYNVVQTADSTNGCYEGNFFLTEKAAKEYIERNKHNLSNPGTYGIHLYRNPEMERLYEIIHKLSENKDETKKNN